MVQDIYIDGSYVIDTRRLYAHFAFCVTSDENETRFRLSAIIAHFVGIE